MKSFRQHIEEKRETYTLYRYGKPKEFPILFNPKTETEVTGVLKNSTVLRFIYLYKEKEVYVWDAFHATHDDVATSMGKDWKSGKNATNGGWQWGIVHKYDDDDVMIDYGDGEANLKSDVFRTAPGLKKFRLEALNYHKRK